VRKVQQTLAPYAEAAPENTAGAMRVVAELIQGRRLTEEFWEPTKRVAVTHTWRPVMTRGVHTGDTVRVRHDAYEGEAAIHNGRVGKVVALRNGVIVAYEDTQGKSARMGVRHPPGKLELQVPIKRRVTK
jgi:hypothetical protein